MPPQTAKSLTYRSQVIFFKSASVMWSRSLSIDGW